MYIGPKVTYSNPKMTYSDPKGIYKSPMITYIDHKVTHSVLTHQPSPAPTSPEPNLLISFK